MSSDIQVTKHCECGTMILKWLHFILEIFEDVDDQYYFVNTLFTEITNEHIPLKTRNIKRKQPPF